jgi:hypothetical protein
MRLLLFITLLIAAVETHAQRVPNPIPGLQAALQFCMGIRDDAMITECVRLESGANWVTPEALPICSNQNFDEDRISCLRGIVNIQIRPEEVRVCDSLTFDDEKAKCLAEIRRPFPYRTRIKVDPVPGRDQAANLCSSFFSDDDKKRCLMEMTRADLLTVDAVRFCSEQFSDDDKIQCLGRLKDHFIVAEEVSLCKKVFTDEGQLGCLSGVQRKYVKTRP